MKVTQESFFQNASDGNVDVAGEEEQALSSSGKVWPAGEECARTG